MKEEICIAELRWEESISMPEIAPDGTSREWGKGGMPKQTANLSEEKGC